MDKVYENILNIWRDHKGKGSVLIPAPFDNIKIIVLALDKTYTKNSELTTCIIVNSFDDRMELVETIIGHNKKYKDLIDNRKLLIYTPEYICRNRIINSDLCIIHDLNTIDKDIVELLKNSKFILGVFTMSLYDSTSQFIIYKLCPFIYTINQDDVDYYRTSTPVEDIQLAVPLDETTEDYKRLKYYNEYIETTLNIFGSFEIMQQARLGNTALNISANTICAKIAAENGWNEHLDMSIEYNRKIDQLYNPSMLRERATTTYDIIRQRGSLLASNEHKLETIWSIVKENINKKILIINKQSEFATAIANYINDNVEKEICKPYHNKLEVIQALDDQGNPVTYKTGKKKGKLKYLAAKAQKSKYEKMFNFNRINILSTNNAPDVDLTINVDIVIITSPLCSSIENYLYRLSNCQFNRPLKLFSLYMQSSLEEKKILSICETKTHKIVNNCENRVIMDNNSDFIIVD